MLLSESKHSLDNDGAAGDCWKAFCLPLLVCLYLSIVVPLYGLSGAQKVCDCKRGGIWFMIVVHESLSEQQ